MNEEEETQTCQHAQSIIFVHEQTCTAYEFTGDGQEYEDDDDYEPVLLYGLVAAKCPECDFNEDYDRLEDAPTWVQEKYRFILQQEYQSVMELHTMVQEKLS